MLCHAMLQKLGHAVHHWSLGVQAWLDILPKMMNTAVVLLCDRGQACTERALITYAALHRLFLALCQRHDLFDAARSRVQKFAASEAHRVKVAPAVLLCVPLIPTLSNFS